jgi:hypothetical protein
MVRVTGLGRVGSAGKICFTTALALLAWAPGGAVASTGGAATPAAHPTAKGSPAGSPASAPSAGALTVVAARATPRKSFFYGFRFPRLAYTIASSQPQNDIRIDVVSASGEAVRTFYRDDVAPDVPQAIRWDGTTATGRPARNGRYSFRISPQGAAPPARTAAATTGLRLGFSLYGYAFPVLGSHQLDMGAGRFGAARAGHTHQGQDVMSACGTPVVAARGGKVQYAGFQAAAGNYVVVDGIRTGVDFMYAHLAEPSPLHTGDPVRTGQPIGIVGQTGDATACHLHFEMWSAPGWYEGGAPFDPLGSLRKWDRYS